MNQETKKFLEILVEDIHSTIVATIDKEGHPITRVIDMMLWDEKGLYFLTAKGKEFYEQLMEQKYISLSSIKDKRSISLRGKIVNIGKEKLDEIFEKNTYMQGIYPEDTRDALDVFCLCEAKGEFFDISNPSNVTRGSIVIGDIEVEEHGYFVGEGCIGCEECFAVCPQKCIDVSKIPAVIDQEHCLHCGRCEEACPEKVIKKM
ncbi:hypothetical protein P261_00548 [Lachnospiraceae bacterium TWA4]|nr:hypothetical protein P261_00548 [Lachnospiraceae bacterium TWA4]